MKYFLNIIIPTYNSAKTIIKTIDSILEDARTVTNKLDVQLIVSDDGSSDTIEQLINSKNYKNVELLLNPHHGVSSSRNSGLAHCTKGFVLFFDSDDLWASGSFESMLDHKWSYFNVQMFNNDYQSVSYIPFSEDEREHLQQNIAHLSKPYMQAGVCGNVYQLDFLKKNKLSFNPRLRMGEDLIFNLQTMEAATSMYLSNVKSLIYTGGHSKTKFNSGNLDNELIFNQQLLEVLPITEQDYKNLSEQNLNTNFYTRFCLSGLAFMVNKYFVYKNHSFTSQVKAFKSFIYGSPYSIALQRFKNETTKYPLRKKDQLIFILASHHLYTPVILFVNITKFFNKN